MCIAKKGEHCVIGNNVSWGENITLGHNCIIEDSVIIENNVFIDSNTTVRRGAKIGAGSFIGANCVIGEYLMDFCLDRKSHDHPLTIGKNALIRSGSIIYAGSQIGENFQTGHQVTIRENAQIGDNVSVGTLSDIQGYCKIGNYVRFQSKVYVAQFSKIDDFVWIFPSVVFTNDPTPPSENMVGSHIHSFAIVAAGAIILPGLDIGQDCLVGAGSIVTKPVKSYAVVVGNPAKTISDVRKIKNKITGEPVYPWREHFSKYMPWDGVGFDAWYASLDIPDKEYYTLSDLVE